MGLENIFKKFSKVGRRIVLSSLILASSIAVADCVPSTLTLDTAQNGMIYGRTLIPQTQNNKVIWVGQGNAGVKINGGTSYTVASQSDGTYAQDGIPTGAYSVEAYYPSGSSVHYYDGTSSGVVTRQGQTEVDVQMMPTPIAPNSIIYGKILQSGYPYVGAITFWNTVGTSSGPTPYQQLGSATTNSDGTYAISISNSIERDIIELDSKNNSIKISGAYGEYGTYYNDFILTSNADGTIQ